MSKRKEYFLARITTRGQITVPAEVRAPSQEFEAFARPIRERFAKKGITKEDIDEAIRWAREKKERTEK